jgi:hypothetical protein
MQSRNSDPGGHPGQHHETDAQQRQAQYWVREGEPSQPPPQAATEAQRPQPQLRPPVPAPRRGRAAMFISVAAAGVALAGFGGSAFMYAHARDVSNGNGAQIRTLEQGQARMAGEISNLRAQLASVDSAQGQLSQRLNSQPAPNTIITCHDVKSMGLTLTTGGNVPSVPGPVDLSTVRAALPRHCA